MIDLKVKVKVYYTISLLVSEDIFIYGIGVEKY